MNQLYIRNVSGGVFKIPFKLGTPYDVQKLVNGTILNGKGTLIPADVVPHIDMDRLKYHSDVEKSIKVKVKKFRVPRVGIKPQKLSIKEVKKPKATKVDKVLVNKNLKVKEEK